MLEAEVIISRYAKRLCIDVMRKKPILRHVAPMLTATDSNVTFHLSHHPIYTV